MKLQIQIGNDNSNLILMVLSGRMHFHANVLLARRNKSINIAETILICNFISESLFDVLEEMKAEFLKCADE